MKHFRRRHSDLVCKEIIRNNNFLKLGNINIKDRRRLRAPEFYPANPCITSESELKMIFSEAIQSGEVIATESEIQEEWERLRNRINKHPKKSFNQFNKIKKVSGALLLFIVGFSISYLFLPKGYLPSLNKQNPSILYPDGSKEKVGLSNHESNVFTESHSRIKNAKIPQSIIESIHKIIL